MLEAIIAKLPAPQGDNSAPLKALLVDSWYDPYLGVMTLVRVRDGVLKKGMKIRMMATGAVHNVERVGVFRPKPETVDQLGPGEIGFINAGVKTVSDAKVGDTITEDRRVCSEALPGFKPSVPVVFCGLFPIDAADFSDLREALEKLSLNDSSFSFEAETSAALGFGFRCGFLGLLHMEVIRERLSREFDLDLISTAPSVVYKLNMTDGKVIDMHNPADMPEVTKIDSLEEPWIKATIMAPDEYLGQVLSLCVERRGEQRRELGHGHEPRPGALPPVAPARNRSQREVRGAVPGNNTRGCATVEKCEKRTHVSGFLSFTSSLRRRGPRAAATRWRAGLSPWP